MEQRNRTLGEFIIEKQEDFQYSSGELSRIINSIRLAAKVVNYKVNKAGLVDIIGAAGEQNIQGEDQQNTQNRALGARVGHPLWTHSGKQRAQAQCGCMTPMVNFPLACLVKAMYWPSGDHTGVE